MLELWHGPTCAFKDMALQILPRFLTVASKKIGDGKTTVILVATSGDTGKAALEGFRDVEGTKILVFYPEDGVSMMQKLQMRTQEGENVGVCAIRGNFDDAQTGVKKIFTSEEMAKLLEENGMQFSSANSINWGRLLPQIVYYFSAYCDAVNKLGMLDFGEEINFVVPTGNFGDILAGYYAKKMGLPIKKLICASNSNNVLTDFINRGTYDKNRPFYTTESPSMDILVSSNLERLLYDVSGCDDAKVRRYMDGLKDNGVYTVDNEICRKIAEDFAGGWCDDAQAEETIKNLFDSKHYLCDTHTAVAACVAEKYRDESKDNTPAVILSTASPYKFTAAVLKAVNGVENNSEPFAQTEELAQVSGTEIPKPIKELRNKEVRFDACCDKDDMKQAVLSMLGIN